MREYQLFVNGSFIPTGNRSTFEVINPSTEEVVSRVPMATREDVAEAISIAKAAQKDWAKLPAIQRAAYLHEIAALVRDNLEHLARTVAEEQGKAMSICRAEVSTHADTMDFVAEYARRYEGEIVQSDRANENILIYKVPIGVVAGVLPWNYPFSMIARKVAPALLTGNTIVIKPSSEAPNNAFEFAKLVAQTSLPKGVFQLLSGSGSVVGNALASSPDVGMVSMTGSVPAGAAIMAAAAPNITKVSLELGGKAPAIVMPDADMDLAVKCICDSRIVNAGQVCNCAERVYVHQSVAEQFTTKMVAAMQQVRYGNVLADDTLDMGPLVSRDQLQSVERAVAEAIKEGAVVACGGQRAAVEKGYFYQPTVLTNCKHSMKIMHEEIFGPVLPIATFETVDEAFARANDCEYGLTSSIYTNDYNVVMRACNELQFGETYVNRENGEALQGFHAGVRKSGIGGADGKHGLQEYLQTHTVYLQYDNHINEVK